MIGPNKSRLFGRGFFILHFSFFLLHVLSLHTAHADDSPKYAERGMAAYYSGKYDLARLFFSKALHDAVLKGKEEWIAKATLNLVDVELDAHDETEAERLLAGLNTRVPATLAVCLWKRSQLAFLQRRHDLALNLIDSALTLSKGDEGKRVAMQMDQVRYRIAAREPSVWLGQYESLRKNLGRPRSTPLDALAAMARKEYAKADTLWREAMETYRSQGRLARVAGSLNQSAICLFSMGRREEALEMNARAVAIFAELGLDLPGLKAQALRLLLLEDALELAKLRQDMDLVGQRFSGFDLKGILDEYSHGLRTGSTGPKR